MIWNLNFTVPHRMYTKAGHDPKNFSGIFVEDVPVVQEILERNSFLYNFDIGEGKYEGELIRRILEKKIIKTLKLLRSTIISFIHMLLIANYYDTNFLIT